MSEELAGKPDPNTKSPADAKTSKAEKGFEQWNALFKYNPLFRATNEEVGKLTEVPHIVKDLIPENSMGILSGLPGSHKTWIALQLGLSIASGYPFLGRYDILKKGGVLYLDFENSANMIKVRIRKLLYGDVAEFAIISANGLYFNTDGVPSFGPASILQEKTNMEVFYSRVKSLCKENNIVLLIIDTLRSSYIGEENSSQVMAVLLSKLREIMAASGCSIMSLHHIGKPSNGSRINYDDVYAVTRGSSALGANADYVFAVEKDEETSTEETDAFKLIQAKNRFGRLLTKLRIFMTEDSTTNKVSFRSEYIVRFPDLREELLAALREKPEGMRHNELIPAKVERRSSKKATLQELVIEGLISKTDGVYKIAVVKPTVEQSELEKKAIDEI